MSLRPGIGARAADRIARDFYSSRAGAAALVRDGDVSRVVRHDRRKWPLGRYLVSRVRDGVGVGEAMREKVDVDLRALADELREPGARELREGKRHRMAASIAASEKLKLSRRKT